MSTPDTDSCPMREEVKALVYWKNPIKSGSILLVLLVAQFSFLCMSAISIAAYLGFFLFVSVNLCRLYYHYIAKTESQIIKDYLECDVTLPKDRIVSVTERLTDNANDILAKARDVFLLTNISASIKFGLVLYLLTYVGARFNFLTLCILATLLAFFIPKFYESYRSEIDHVLQVLREKIGHLMTQISERMDKLPVVGSRKTKTQ